MLGLCRIGYQDCGKHHGQPTMAPPVRAGGGALQRCPSLQRPHTQPPLCPPLGGSSEGVTVVPTVSPSTSLPRRVAPSIFCSLTLVRLCRRCIRPREDHDTEARGLLLATGEPGMTWSDPRASSSKALSGTCASRRQGLTSWQSSTRRIARRSTSDLLRGGRRCPYQRWGQINLTNGNLPRRLVEFSGGDRRFPSPLCHRVQPLGSISLSIFSSHFTSRLRLCHLLQRIVVPVQLPSSPSAGK